MGISSVFKSGFAAATVAIGALASQAALAETIKVGVLHSLSGTMAISETTLKDAMLRKRGN
jgi:urea transport system substrate-binding protein